MHTGPLSPRQRRTLDALCSRIAPDVSSPGTSGTPLLSLAAEVEARLAAADAPTRRKVAALLAVFGSPVAGLLTRGSFRRFTRLPAAEQERWLRQWEESRLGVRRTMFQALRRLILSTFYALPTAQREIGYRGPLHTREPVVPWEGALSGTPDDGEPVARTGTGDASAGSREATTPPLHATPADGRVEQTKPRGLTEGHELPAERLIRAGVCVIGTGAGGAVAAARLAEAGHDVVLLEEGGYWTAADFTEQEAEMTARLYAEAGARATDDLSVSILQGRSVGGSTTVNWLVMLRTPEWVLDEWAREYGALGLSPAELAPVFRLIEQETHASVVPGDAHSPNNRIILDGARELGWSAYAAKINARGCIRSGFCGLGCRYGAKQSTQATYIPRALAAGARLFSDVRAERIRVVERGGRAPLKRVEATVIDRATGQPRGRLVVEAPVVVLAAGAVGTPALLQRSGMGGGGVGKYLRLHPTTAVAGRYAREIYAAAGIPLSAVCDEFLRGEGGYGFWIECPPLHPALAAIATPGFGVVHRTKMQHFPQMGSLIILVRDGAGKDVSSGEVRVDRRGRTRIRYRLNAADRRQMVEGVRAAARLHLAAGAEEALTSHTRECRVRSEADLDSIGQQQYGPNQVALFSAHVNGTCRIGTDPRTSGCTPQGERHGFPGVYVADGSLLPTAPGVNPQETIMAVATVIAQRIAERHPAG